MNIYECESVDWFFYLFVCLSVCLIDLYDCDNDFSSAQLRI